MTIRSKKRKAAIRAESERLAAERKAAQGVARVVAAVDPANERLDPREATEIELRAMREAWLPDDGVWKQARLALMQKVVKVGIATDATPEIAIKALRAVATAEQRAHALRLQALKMLMPKESDLPPQVNVNVVANAASASMSAPAPAALKPFELIQQLIAKKEVRDALAPTNGSGFSESDQHGRMGDTREV